MASPNPFRKSYVTTVFCHDVFGREAFNATIKEREEADLLISSIMPVAEYISGKFIFIYFLSVELK